MPPRTRTPIRPPEHDIKGMWVYVTGMDVPLDFTFSKEHVDIRDIAHALSLINRFNGHTSNPLSVAEHSVRVAEHMEVACRKVGKRAPSAKERLAALLHDAAEAYIGDICQPLKRQPEMAYIVDLEDHILGAIHERWNISLSQAAWTAIKRADGMAFAEEWENAAGGNLGPEAAERSFLAKFQYLHRDMVMGS